MKNKNVKAIISFVIMLVFFYWVYFFTPTLKESACGAYKDFKLLQINGVVEKKYVDSSEHSYPILEVRNFANKLDTLNLVFDETDFFELIKINDTLIKNINDKLILIKNKNGSYKKELNFGCSN